MRFLTILGIFFYSVIVILVGTLMIAVAFDFLQPEYISNILALVGFSIRSRLILGLSGLLMILVSLSFAQLMLGKIQRERTIAFKTGSGEVTIALSAVEDLIKRLAVAIPEIKELRPNVLAGKKGILVDIRAVLNSESNIPDLTQRLNDIARAKIQEVLGIEEQVIIRIHVAKITPLSDKERKKREQEKTVDNIPFSGYGRA